MSSIDLLSIINEARNSFGEGQVRHNDFVARAIDELEGDNYETFVVQNSNKTKSNALNLNQDQCLLISMRESKKVRRYVLEKLKSIKSPQLPQSKREWIEFALEQEKKLELAAPKVEFHDTVVQTNNTYKYQEAGKKIQQRPNKFVEWLRIEKYIDKVNAPYQRYIDQGLFKMNSGVSEFGHAYTQGRMTSKGLAYFTNKLGSTKL